MTETQKPKVVEEVVELSLDHVHPDPFQPRVHPDSELADSIKSQGVLVPITVEPLPELDVECDHCNQNFLVLADEESLWPHYMIQNGERRFQGSLAAKRKTIKAIINPPASEADRLVHQLTTNIGKPLTPVEEAFAFKRIMEANGWSQVQLAKHLGRPRSVIGDRIRLAELHPAWLKLIDQGVLQPSHAAILSPYAPVPAEYQEKAAAILAADYRVTSHTKAGEPVPIDDFKYAIFGAFNDFLKRTTDVKGYRGPVVEVTDRYGYRGSRTKYAADIKLWRPIFNKHQRALKKARDRAGSGGHSSGGMRRETNRLLALGLTERVTSDYYPDANKGEIKVYTDRWEDGLEPNVFLKTVDQSKLVLAKGKHTVAVMTTDEGAVTAAREAFEAGYAKRVEPQIAKVRKDLPAAIAKWPLSGAGVRPLLSIAYDNEARLPFLAAALGIVAEMPDTEDEGYPEDGEPIAEAFPGVSDADLERLASAYIAASLGDIKLPNVRQARWDYLHKRINLPFDLPKAKATPAEAARVSENGVGATESTESVVGAPGVADAEPPKRKRGRPSNAEKAARAAAQEKEVAAT